MRLLLIALVLVFPAALSADEVLFEMDLNTTTTSRPIDLPNGYEVQYEYTPSRDQSVLQILVSPVDSHEVYAEMGPRMYEPKGQKVTGTTYGNRGGRVVVEVHAMFLSGKLRIVKVE